MGIPHSFWLILSTMAHFPIHATSSNLFIICLGGSVTPGPENPNADWNVPFSIPYFRTYSQNVYPSAFQTLWGMVILATMTPNRIPWHSKCTHTHSHLLPPSPPPPPPFTHTHTRTHNQNSKTCWSPLCLILLSGPQVGNWCLSDGWSSSCMHVHKV